MAENLGDAELNITGKDAKLNQTLAGAEQNTKASMTRMAQATGAAFAAVGAVITATIVSSVSEFAKVGDEINKLSIRTGVAAETLSAWGFVAEQNDATLQDLGKGFLRMADFVTAANDGLGSATSALEIMGLSVADLQGKSPEQLFLTMADAIARMPDPLMQSAVAQDVFGRAGFQLLPMLKSGSQGIAELSAEAEKLGRVLSEDDAAAAAEFNDNLNELSSSFSGIKMEIARALIPALNELVPVITNAIVSFREWVAANPELTASIVKIAAVLGPVLTALGGFLIVLPAISAGFSALGPIITAVGVVIAAIASPIGIAIAAAAALAAAGVWIVQNWEQVTAFFGTAWTFIVDSARLAADLIKDIVQGIIGWIEDAINGFLDLIGLAGNVDIPGNASGTSNFRGGLTHISEEGGEIVNLPRGAQIIPHDVSMEMAREAGRAAATGGGGGIGDTSIAVSFPNANFSDSGNAERVVDMVIQKLNQKLDERRGQRGMHGGIFAT